MKIHTINFVASNTSYQQCPYDSRPEVAFIGRSNVGKSSLINALLQRKQLAKVSKTPGKTQCINHYLINDRLYFVDLPGYGWAQVGHATKAKWEKMVHAYLLHRTQLVTLFVLIDAKIATQPIDLTCIRWLGIHHIPFAIILTKADQKYKMVAQKNYKALLHILEQEWATLPPIFSVSARDKLGMDALRAYIQKITAQFIKPIHRIETYT